MEYSIKYFYRILIAIVALLPLLTILILIIQRPPDEWAILLKLWLPYLVILFAFIVGAIAILTILYRKINLLSYNEEQLGPIINHSLKNGKDIEVLVFAYTSETLDKFINFKSHYKNVRIKVLLRNWVSEWKEQKNHNIEIKKSRSTARPWKKVRTIVDKVRFYRDQSNTKMGYVIDTKFFDYPPILKGIIVINNETRYSEGYIGFFKWIPSLKLIELGSNGPGGSPYKGYEGSVIHLHNKGNEYEKDLLDRYISQFRLHWEIGKNFHEVFIEETNLILIHPKEGKSPLKINCNAENCFPLPDDIIDYHWNFGDGTDSHGMTVDHIYQKKGSYSLTLTIKDVEDQTGHYSFNIEVA